MIDDELVRRAWSSLPCSRTRSLVAAYARLAMTVSGRWRDAD